MSTKGRFLLVTHRFWPRYRAGVENYTAELAGELERRGCNVAVATTEKVLSRPMGHVDRQRLGRIPVFEVVNHHAFATFEETFVHPRMCDALESIVAETRPDVIHFQHLMYWSTDAVRRLVEQGRDVRITLHDYWSLCGRMGQLIDHRSESCAGPSVERCTPCLANTPFAQGAAEQRWIARLGAIRRLTGVALDAPARYARTLLASRRATPPSAPSRITVSAEEQAAWRERIERRERSFLDALFAACEVITPSTTLARMIAEWSGGRVSPRVVPQGRDPVGFDVRGMRAGGGPVRAVFIGQVAPHKGVHVLVEAVAGMSPGSIELDVYGPAEHHPEYLERCRRLAGDHLGIRFRGPVPRSEIPRVLAGADVHCLPSLWNECCPLSIQEATLARVPSIVSGIGGMAELVENEVSGLHVAPGDVGGWRRALTGIVAEIGRLESFAARLPRVPTVAEHVDDLYGTSGGS